MKISTKLGIGAFLAAAVIGGGAAVALYVSPENSTGQIEPVAAHGPLPDNAALTVVELFTSQSCSSCPPAEAFLAELVEQHDNVLGLEFHVTYWDNLVAGSQGRWKDIFSDPSHTQRQRVYNERLRGRPAVFTPQMVIGGAVQAVGTRRDEVLGAISMVARGDRKPVALEVDWIPAGGLAVSVWDFDANGPTGDIWLVTYEPARATFIPRGENAGRTLQNHNIVHDLRHLGRWSGGDVTVVEVGEYSLSADQRCAVLLQGPQQGPIYAAARCPDAPI
ncbi:MAG: DUF1223 domain-containing protein [Alphaproteobacteria bacterium]|nr:DUF1223 domain-containing protein [Alphaproteobacteria bacterium]